MSDLQRDIDVVDSLVRQLNGWGLSSEESSAWRRLRARLTPDRERVTEAVQRAAREVASPLSDFAARHVADAAIKAMEGKDDHA